jgi:dolichol-phosphate mannosyltransferase
LISKAATEIAKKGLGVQADDPMSGFFAFKKNLIKDVSFDAIGYKVLLELLVKTNAKKIQEIPYTFTDRKFGSSKLGTSTILDYCKSVWKLYRYGKSAAKQEGRISVKFLSKAARFFTVGASGLGVNYLSSVFFTSTFDMWYLHATIIGILFGITSNFFLHKYWTFGDRNFSLKRTIIQYSKFAVLSSVSGLVQIGMVYYFVSEFSLSYPISLLLAVLTAAFSNFVLNKRWTFNEKVWS